MAYPDDTLTTKTTDEVRAGSTEHVLRYMLGFSLLAAIIVMTLVWVIPAVM